MLLSARARIVLCFGLAIAFTLGWVVVAGAHEAFDEDGKGNKFEYYCCRHGQDCNRVHESDLVFQADGSVKHLPTGKVFPRDTHKPSTNKHQYACIYKGDPRCLYLRYGY